MLLCTGAITTHKFVSRDSNGQIITRTIASVTSKADRPWVGEMSLWQRKPRMGTAVVTAKARLLIIDSSGFEQFLSLAPDFRMYLNRGRAVTEEPANKSKLGVTLKESVIEEEQNKIITAAAVKWGTGGKFGGIDAVDDRDDMSLFAERWVRLVTYVLKKAGIMSEARHTTVSFKASDYQTLPVSPRAARSQSENAMASPEVKVAKPASKSWNGRVERGASYKRRGRREEALVIQA